MNTLYPAIEPYMSSRLNTGDGHSLYYEQCGNPNGKPVIFLHGGPGLGCRPDNRRFFDPERYRIILMDQRGSGRSTPFASLDNNTTWHLVADIEQLRAHLEIERWQVFGGSWGSTLALAYAQSHPGRVTELVVRGIFMLRKAELDWFYQDGASQLFPDAWADYVEAVPKVGQQDFLAAYHEMLTRDDIDVQNAAARAWCRWEGATSKLRPNSALVDAYSSDNVARAMARIEAHYFVNAGFFKSSDQLLKDVDKIRDIPATIVQGRYDVVTPMRTAWDLHEAWPEADWTLVPDAGHSALEVGTTDALIRATDGYAKADLEQDVVRA
ncbi:MAG: prolyl aminopeptidase [Pseudomonadota bacterium]